VDDLSPLRDTSVKELYLDQCYGITDLTPLMDCKQLEALTVPTHTSDIAFLRNHPSLKRLSNHSIEYFGWTPSKMPTVAQFFEKHGERLARQVPMEKQLAKFRQSLIEQGNDPKDVPRFVFDAEGELDIRLYNLTCFDISALQGVAVTKFYCNSRSLVDLSPLAGAPLKSLDIPSTGVSDLSFLKRVPLKLVRLHATRVKDLSPLRGLPLEKFLFDGKAEIDVSLLAEIPTLQEILVPEDATGILALKRLPKLRLLSYRPTNTTGLVPDQTAAEFWKQHGVRLERQAPMEKQLEKFRQSLIAQGNAPDKVPRFAFKADGGLMINLLNYKMSDISELRGVAVTDFICDGGLSDLAPLTGAPLAHLHVTSAAISDLSPLRGAPLKTLYIPNTSVRDLSPLRGAPLERLWISRTQITDASALLEFPQLKEILLPAGAKNVEALKKLSKLARISFNGSCPGGAVPAQTAADFWKEFEAKQKK
jgi:Leucine-rich repeat (LRR) protein